MGAFVKAALILLVVLFGLAFHLRNGQQVNIDYYLDAVEIPLSLALALALLIGAACGAAAGLPTLFRLRRDKAKLGRRLKTAETEREQEAAQAKKRGGAAEQAAEQAPAESAPAASVVAAKKNGAP